MDVVTEVVSTPEIYVPSAVERKKALLMYMFFGVLFTISQKKIGSPYESFHIKQAIWRRLTFCLLVLVGSIFIFLPVLKFLPILGILVWIAVWWFCAKQARDGKYLQDAEHDKMWVLAAMWSWVCLLFEVDVEEKK